MMMKGCGPARAVAVVANFQCRCVQQRRHTHSTSSVIDDDLIAEADPTGVCQLS